MKSNAASSSRQANVPKARISGTAGRTTAGSCSTTATPMSTTVPRNTRGTQIESSNDVITAPTGTRTSTSSGAVGASGRTPAARARSSARTAVALSSAR